jgi:hypothetical protein
VKIEKRKTVICFIIPIRAKIFAHINNFTLLNAAFGSPPLEDLTGQAIINHQSNQP